MAQSMVTRGANTQPRSLPTLMIGHAMVVASVAVAKSEWHCAAVGVHSESRNDSSDSSSGHGVKISAQAKPSSKVDDAEG